jgi:hypothetical protein
MARTVAKVIEYLQTLKQDEYIAVPFIWTKDDAQDWHSNDISDEHWEEIIDSFEDDDEMNDFSNSVMAEAIAEVTTPEV